MQKKAWTKPVAEIQWGGQSALGFFFLLPVKYEGGWTIPMGVLADLLTKYVGQYMPIVVLVIVVVSAVLTGWFSLVKRPPAAGYPTIRDPIRSVSFSIFEKDSDRLMPTEAVFIVSVSGPRRAGSLQ